MLQVRPVLLSVFACVASSLAFPSTVAAAPEDSKQSTLSPADELPSEAVARAEALFEEGRELRSHGRDRQACDLFEESQRLDPAAGTLYHLADCQEATNQLLLAYQNFSQLVQLTQRAGDTQREAVAQMRVARLTAALSFLTLEVANANADLSLQIRHNDKLLSPELWHTPIAVEPIEQHIEVSAPGHIPWQEAITVSKGDSATLEIPKLEPIVAESVDASSVSAPAHPRAMEDLSIAPSLGPGDPERDLHSAGLFDTPLGQTGAILGGASALGLGLSGVFLVDALKKRANARERCEDSVCDSSGANFYADARASANTSTWLFASGVALGLGSAACLLWPPTKHVAGSDTPVANSPRVHLSVGPSKAALTGQW